ncbi:PTS ascorbate transporter subunit IIC [Sporolactobacillus laevolacticus]|uniref:PTS ascorbate transporter subunit IIC n=1 Tax=Sporolactobacillus laevolacticus TaxID=33018 RepID=UPI0025B51DEF|nr:PTS ascorbate transporter subunit IIC [Sporolactobacillus laevolacticus]MDN3956650.1 PTS ascorbate transporter subunit IIC [Sporolactobacillus laevolacticus]
MIQEILNFFQSVISQPALLLGLMSMVGLLALKSPAHKVLTGTLGPILGYLMLSAGATFIVSSLDPLGKMINHGFHIRGVVPNNEAIVAVAQKVLGVNTMLILVLGLLLNLFFARVTKYKYVFLTGHHSFYMACLLSAVLSATGINSFMIVLCGGILLGAWSAISPAIGQRYTLKVTDGDEIAMGHFGSLGYYLSSWIGSKVGDPEKSTEKLEIPEKWGFLRNTTIATAITMVFFYLVAAIAAGPKYIETISNGQSPFIFAIINGLNFAVGVAVVYAGVRMILADLIPAFQGIAKKVIPNAVPAVDCAVFFTYGQTAVIIGFVCSFIGGVIGMLLLGVFGGVLIVPGLVPHFFCGATAGIFGNATGGRRGAIAGSFVYGLLLAFLPAALLPVLGGLGFANTTFGDLDFTLIGILLGQSNSLLGSIAVYAIVIIALLALFIPNLVKTKTHALNNYYDEDENSGQSV